MLQILYVVAFTLLSLIAVSNLIKSMIALSEVKPPTRPLRPTLHPELIDENGKVTEEPLLVMRSLDFDDARSRLDAIYNSSPNPDS